GPWASCQGADRSVDAVGAFLGRFLAALGFLLGGIAFGLGAVVAGGTLVAVLDLRALGLGDVVATVDLGHLHLVAGFCGVLDCVGGGLAHLARTLGRGVAHVGARFGLRLTGVLAGFGDVLGGLLAGLFRGL